MDPGKASGLAYSVAGDCRTWTLDRTETEDWLELWVRRADLVVVESFIINAGTIKKAREGNVSLELIGVARYLARKARTEFKLQTPSEAKSFSTDEKLRRIGWHVRESDHQRDARRHLVLALATAGEPDMIRRLIPPKEEEQYG